MNRELISKAMGSIDDRHIQDASRYDPEGICSRPERVAMKSTEHFIRPRKLSRRIASFAAAACIVLAISITGFAAYQLTMDYREAKPAEEFPLGPTLDEKGKIIWDNGTLKNAKLVLEFEGPEECNAIRFKPGWLPSEPTSVGAYSPDEEGWYTNLDGADLNYFQPYLVNVYYTSQFLNDGNMVLHNYTPEDITEEVWGDYQILKIEASQDIPGNRFFGTEAYTTERNYYIMFHQTLGYIIVISGHDTDIATLERIGQNLEIDVTDTVISSEDYHEYTAIVDGALG